MRISKIWISLIFIVTIFGCKKEMEDNSVDVKSKEVTSIRVNSALSGGFIDNVNKMAILEVGVCWDTLSLPTISSNRTIETVQELPSFEFKSSLTGLKSSKDYYARAYAKTNNGVFYGSQQKFTTLPLDSFIVDFDYILDQEFAPSKLTIINNSKYTDSYQWSFEGANNLNSTLFSPTNIQYNSGGSYTITLTGCSDKNCRTVSKTIKIENYDIEFNDIVLEKRLRTFLNKPTGPITRIYAKTITKLNLSRPTNDTTYIQNIDVLKYFTSLKELTLTNNKIYDITILSNLTSLEVVDLYKNEVVGISPLENLVNLKVLNLWLNNIEDISPLSKLTKMEELNIGANMIKDISPLKGIISIKSLWLNANAYTVDTLTIQSLTNLTTLGVTNCKLSSINFVKDLTKLVDLLFESNNITDISVLKNFTNLRSLFCGYNHIKDITVLENLYNNGCFRLSNKFSYHIGITYNGINATEGSENRRVIDMLAGNSVKISWQAGNTY